MTTPELEPIVLAHPYRHHLAGAVIDVTPEEARRLVSAGYARRLLTVIEPLAGGWFAVPINHGHDRIKVRGLDKARRRLEREALRR